MTNQAVAGLCSEERQRSALKTRSLLKPVDKNLCRPPLYSPNLSYKTKPIGAVYPGKGVKHVFSFQLNLYGVIQRHRANREHTACHWQLNFHSGSQQVTRTTAVAVKRCYGCHFPAGLTHRGFSIYAE